MKTLAQENPLPPGAKSKSKARQHAKSNKREKLNKGEKPKTSSSSVKTDYPCSCYGPDFKHCNKELLEAMRKESFIGRGKTSEEDAMRNERLIGPEEMSEEEEEWPNDEEFAIYLGLDLPVFRAQQEAMRRDLMRRLNNNFCKGGRLRNELVSKPESPKESPSAISDSGKAERPGNELVAKPESPKESPTATCDSGNACGGPYSELYWPEYPKDSPTATSDSKCSKKLAPAHPSITISGN